MHVRLKLTLSTKVKALGFRPQKLDPLRFLLNFVVQYTTRLFSQAMAKVASVSGDTTCPVSLTNTVFSKNVHIKCTYHLLCEKAV